MASDRWRRAALVAVGFIATVSVSTAYAREIIEQSIQVPINDLAGHRRVMAGRICRPAGIERPKLVVMNHGSTTLAADRPYLPIASCENEAVRWFTDRHYAVVQVWRLGYGASNGPWTEGFAQCSVTDYYKAGLETARQISAIVEYAVSLPAVDPNDVIVVGHSGGGWGAIAYDSSPHAHVAAVINMAGGRGGHYHGKANSNCGADQLVEAVRLFARNSSIPMLWIYADNDSYFGPQLASKMATAYVSAGGKLQLYATASYGADGHAMFFDEGGSRIWGPLVQKYLNGISGSATIPER
ncbi:alpha/beta hydrolase family protein [Dyella sp. 20L07]|uniref:alpha/beta hydrolase family protein n=1 Tax=Dyella sp. 20L07 TaxID=3384240 RepID=UPI003D2A89F8